MDDFTDCELELGQHLYACWKHGRQVDVTLSFKLAAETTEVRCHKLVLERASYFRALFSGPLAAAATTSEISVRLDDPSITADAVLACISYLYCDRLELPEINVADHARGLVGALACASVLMCPRLERACVERMRNCLTVDTVVLLLECGKRYYQPSLESAAMHWLCMHAFHSPDGLLHQLSPAVMAELLARPELQLQGTQSIDADDPPPGGLGFTSEWGRYLLAKRFALEVLTGGGRGPLLHARRLCFGHASTAATLDAPRGSKRAREVEEGSGTPGVVDGVGVDGVAAGASTMNMHAAAHDVPPHASADDSTASSTPLSPLGAADERFGSPSSHASPTASHTHTSPTPLGAPPPHEYGPLIRAAVSVNAPTGSIAGAHADGAAHAIARARGAGRAFEAAFRESNLKMSSTASGRPIIDVTDVTRPPTRARLAPSALLPLWEELRLPLLAPTELLAVEGDGLVPPALLMRT